MKKEPGLENQKRAVGLQGENQSPDDGNEDYKSYFRSPNDIEQANAKVS
jgi:hypothetical protein